MTDLASALPDGPFNYYCPALTWVKRGEHPSSYESTEIPTDRQADFLDGEAERCGYAWVKTGSYRLQKAVSRKEVRLAPHRV